MKPGEKTLSANIYVIPPCSECQRRKKKCRHEDASGFGPAGNNTPGSSPDPVRVGDYHPQSILTDLSAPPDGRKIPSSTSQRSSFRLTRNASSDASMEKRLTEWWNHHRCRPALNPLHEHQQRYLEHVGAFLVLPRSTTDALVTPYISVIDGLVPVLDGTQFLQDYSKGLVSNFLIRAVCLVTCKTEQTAPFLRLHDGDPVLEPLVFAQKLH